MRNESIKLFLKKVRTLLKDESISLAQFKTTDGTILSIDGDVPEVGMEIFVVDQDGLTPAPDGEFVLEDGTTLSIVAGLIDSITPPAPAEEPASEDMPSADQMPADAPVSASEDTKLTELIAKIETLEKENLEIKDILKTLAESLSENNFKSDVKMSLQVNSVKSNMIKNAEKVDLSKMNNPINSELTNIFKNINSFKKNK